MSVFLNDDVASRPCACAAGETFVPLVVESADGPSDRSVHLAPGRSATVHQAEAAAHCGTDEEG